MKGKFFGYKQIDPCPHCGTPRVGADYDDDYYVIPGVLQKPCQWGKHGLVIITVYANDPARDGKRWVNVLVKGAQREGKFVSIGVTLDKFDFYIPTKGELSPTDLKEYLRGWLNCPGCGAPLEFQRKPLGSMVTFKGHCPEKTAQEEIERLSGCEKCATSAHGGHFVD